MLVTTVIMYLLITNLIRLLSFTDHSVYQILWLVHGNIYIIYYISLLLHFLFRPVKMTCTDQKIFLHK